MNCKARIIDVSSWQMEEVLIECKRITGTALWDLTPLFQLYGGQKTNFLIWTVLGEIITVLTCIWLVRTASSLRLAETNSEDPFFFSEVLAQI